MGAKKSEDAKVAELKRALKAVADGPCDMPHNFSEFDRFDGLSFDPVNKPAHYNSHPSGVECVDITEHMTCMIGCAIKYLWRHGQKPGADADQDLQKAIWCIERERQRLKKASNGK